MQADNSSSNSGNKCEEMNLDNQDAIWNFIRQNLQAILDEQRSDCTYTLEEMRKCMLKMCWDSCFNKARLLNNDIRQMVKQHVDKMVAELEHMATSQQWENPIIQQIDQLWFNFADKIKTIRLYLYSMDFGLFIGEDLSMLAYCWGIFRTGILENQLVKQALLSNRLVFNDSENGMQADPPTDDDVVGYKESPLFNVDTIIEIMAFLTTFKVGLQLSMAARQMAKLSDNVLSKRKRILRPIVIWNRQFDGTEPYATHLQKRNTPNFKSKKMQYIFGEWFTGIGPESRICLPDNEAPECLAGVELIYITYGMDDKTFVFLNALRNQLQNCQITLNLRTFFTKMHETGHSSRFFELFNERCFSLMQSNLPWEYRNFANDFAPRWPLWAIFNNIFFPNLRELAGPFDKREVDEMEAAKWLMHPSTEHQPRLLKLPKATVSANWLEWEFVGMLQKIKEDFFNPTGRRMFFVEKTHGRALAALQDQQGEWQNGIGEQLRIHPNGITRLPVDRCHMKFTDFYELLEIQPRLIFR